MKVQINGKALQGDEKFVNDLTLALCHLHERTAERIGKTGDMEADNNLAGELVTIGKVYKGLQPEEGGE